MLADVRIEVIMQRLLKNTILAIFAIACLVPFISATSQAQGTQNFRFSSFSADYYLNRDTNKTSTLKVVETLVAEFPNYDQNHGILRALPQTYQNHTLSLEVISVTNDNGSPWNYTTYEENNNLVLKIGDANRYVQGSQTYVITYTMRNVVLFLDDHDEFYWDVNGDQWPQPFDSVSARIHIPKELSSYLQQRQVCFIGYPSQSNSNMCTIQRTNEGEGVLVEVQTKETVLAGQTMTFGLAFDKDTFVLGPEVAREKLFRKIGIGIAIIGAIIPPLVAFGLMFRRWRAFGNDPKGRGVIVPEYEPPKGLNVVSSDFVLRQTIGAKTFSSALLELAVNKYIRINEIKINKKLRKDSIDYELEITKPLDQVDKELYEIAKAVMPVTEVGTKMKISEISKSITTRTEIAKAITKLKDSLATNLTKDNYFVKNPKAVKSSYRLWSTAPTIVGVLVLFFVSQIYTPFIGIGVGLIAVGVVMIFFAAIMPARTVKGVETHDALLGLKDYINLAEKDRLNFNQSPEGAEKISNGSFDPNETKMQIKLFESLLPYAVLFGLEKKWAEQFKEIYKSPPDWYGGNLHTFNSLYLVNSIHSFSEVSSVSFSPPASSSSGGFSGGGAGGGGGGGGGGGW